MKMVENKYCLGRQIRCIPKERRKQVRNVAQHLWECFREPMVVQATSEELVIAVQTKTDLWDALHRFDNFNLSWWLAQHDRPEYQGIVATFDLTP